MSSPDNQSRSHEKAEKDYVDQLAGENIGPQADGQREQTGCVADNLDGENKPREPPNRAGNVLGIAQGPMVPKSEPVVISKSENGTRERDARVPGGRKENRN